MMIGRVTDSVWATRKNDRLIGIKLLTVMIEETYTMQPRSVIAADNIGAGEGDRVLITLGSSVRLVFQGQDVEPPIDAAIIGIIDERD